MTKHRDRTIRDLPLFESLCDSSLLVVKPAANRDKEQKLMYVSTHWCSGKELICYNNRYE